MRIMKLLAMMSVLLSSECIVGWPIANAADGTVSFLVKSLKGDVLTTNTLNKLRGSNLSDSEYRDTLNIAGSSAAGTTTDSTFNPTTGKGTITFHNVDPNNLIANVRLSGGGLLVPVNVSGISIDDQTIDVVMPIAKTKRCCCSGH